MFLRCFIHFKENIKRELSSRGFSAEVKRLFIDEIFGRRDGSCKFYGLVDRDSEVEFDDMLENLQTDWEERESSRGDGKESFFQWFKKNKVLNSL